MINAPKNIFKNPLDSFKNRVYYVYYKEQYKTYKQYSKRHKRLSACAENAGAERRKHYA
jgi:hypothetical protein